MRLKSTANGKFHSSVVSTSVADFVAPHERVAAIYMDGLYSYLRTSVSILSFYAVPDAPATSPETVSSRVYDHASSLS